MGETGEMGRPQEETARRNVLAQEIEPPLKKYLCNSIVSAGAEYCVSEVCHHPKLSAVVARPSC